MRRFWEMMNRLLSAFAGDNSRPVPLAEDPRMEILQAKVTRLSEATRRVERGAERITGSIDPFEALVKALRDGDSPEAHYDEPVRKQANGK